MMSYSSSSAASTGFVGGTRACTEVDGSGRTQVAAERSTMIVGAGASKPSPPIAISSRPSAGTCSTTASELRGKVLSKRQIATTASRQRPGRRLLKAGRHRKRDEATCCGGH